MKRWIVGLAVATMMVMATAGPASAIVTYDVDDVAAWDWFVGKGDVQSAFGWNAKQSDARFDGVTFTYQKIVTTVTGCVDTERGRYTEVIGSSTEIDTTTRANDVVVRKNAPLNVTGAFVTKAGAPTRTTTGGECDLGYERNSLRETSKTETLSATYGGVTHVLWTLAG